MSPPDRRTRRAAAWRRRRRRRIAAAPWRSRRSQPSGPGRSCPGGRLQARGPLRRPTRAARRRGRPPSRKQLSRPRVPGPPQRHTARGPQLAGAGRRRSGRGPARVVLAAGLTAADTSRADVIAVAGRPERVLGAARPPCTTPRPRRSASALPLRRRQRRPAARRDHASRPGDGRIQRGGPATGSELGPLRPRGRHGLRRGRLHGSLARHDRRLAARRGRTHRRAPADGASLRGRHGGGGIVIAGGSTPGARPPLVLAFDPTARLRAPRRAACRSRRPTPPPRPWAGSPT